MKKTMKEKDAMSPLLRAEHGLNLMRKISSDYLHSVAQDLVIEGDDNDELSNLIQSGYFKINKAIESVAKELANEFLSEGHELKLISRGEAHNYKG